MASVFRRNASQRPAARLRSAGLRRRLVFAFGGFSSAVILATMIPLSFVVTSTNRDGFVDQLQRRAKDVVEAAKADPDRAAGEISARFPPGGDVQALLLDARGMLRNLADPSLFPPSPERAPEVRSALAGETTTHIRPARDGTRLFVAVPIARSGTIDGALWLSAPTQPLDEVNRRTWAALATIGTAGILLAVLVALAVARQIAGRLETVAAGAERFAEGRFGEPIEVPGTDEIAQLGARLNEMARRIESAMAREHDFAAAASHQLRTPLTAIKLRIEELRALGPAGGTAAEYLEEMGQEVDRLTMLASGLLTLAAAESGGPAFEALPAADALEQAIRRLRPLARQGGVEVDLRPIADSAIIAAPKGTFEEVVFNLLDNAVKFSPRGALVDVGAEPQDGYLLVTVGDRGPGLTPQDAEQAFQPFFRTRQGRGVRGSGLGLTICARLCEAAGASIALEPREGGGTLVRVRWPLAA